MSAYVELISSDYKPSKYCKCQTQSTNDDFPNCLAFIIFAEFRMGNIKPIMLATTLIIYNLLASKVNWLGSICILMLSNLPFNSSLILVIYAFKFSSIITYVSMYSLQ